MELPFSPARLKKFQDRMIHFGYLPKDFENLCKVDGICNQVEFKFRAYTTYYFVWRRCTPINRIIAVPHYHEAYDLQNDNEPDDNISESKALAVFDEWLDNVKIHVEVEIQNNFENISPHIPVKEWEKKDTPPISKKVFTIPPEDKKRVLDVLDNINDKYQIPRSAFKQPVAGDIESGMIAWNLKLNDKEEAFFWFRRANDNEGWLNYEPKMQALPENQKEGYYIQRKPFLREVKNHSENWIKAIKRDQDIENDWSQTWGKNEEEYTPFEEIKTNPSPEEVMQKLINYHAGFNKTVEDNPDFTKEQKENLLEASNQTLEEIGKGTYQSLKDWAVVWVPRIYSVGAKVKLTIEGITAIVKYAPEVYGFFYNLPDNIAHDLIRLLH